MKAKGRPSFSRPFVHSGAESASFARRKRARLGRSSGLQLREVALRLRDALDLDGHGLDRLLDALQLLADRGWQGGTPAALEPSAEGARERRADEDRRHHREETVREIYD